AKNIVAAQLADRAEVQVAYAIGKAHPVGVFVETFGTEKVAPERIEKAIFEVFALRPAAIVRALDLLRPIYRPAAGYRDFGRTEAAFSWESSDRAKALPPPPGVYPAVRGRAAAREDRAVRRTPRGRAPRGFPLPSCAAALCV